MVYSIEDVDGPYPPLAFNPDSTAKITGVSRPTQRAWRDGGVYRARIVADPEVGTTRDYFDFRDMLSLRALADARREFRLRPDDVRRAGAYLMDHRDAPWSRLGIGVAGRALVLRDPSTGRWDPDHRAAEVRGLDLARLVELVLDGVVAAQTRPAEMIGRVERRRGVLGGKPVLAGTRIPVEAIQQLSGAGFSTQDIIDDYPHLHVADIEAALAYEASADVA
jgi:uncharacterized protein (DUF433 family)